MKKLTLYLIAILTASVSFAEYKILVTLPNNYKFIEHIKNTGHRYADVSIDNAAGMHVDEYYLYRSSNAVNDKCTVGKISSKQFWISCQAPAFGSRHTASVLAEPINKQNDRDVPIIVTFSNEIGLKPRIFDIAPINFEETKEHNFMSFKSKSDFYVSYLNDAVFSDVKGWKHNSNYSRVETGLFYVQFTSAPSGYNAEAEVQKHNASSDYYDKDKDKAKIQIKNIDTNHDRIRGHTAQIKGHDTEITFTEDDRKDSMAQLLENNSLLYGTGHLDLGTNTINIYFHDKQGIRHNCEFDIYTNLDYPVVKPYDYLTFELQYSDYKSCSNGYAVAMSSALSTTPSYDYHLDKTIFIIKE